MEERSDLDALRQEFNAWADTYDAAVQRGEGVLAGYDRSRRLARQLVQVPKGMRVLDIGIGTGAFASLFAAEGAEITGVDLSLRMLELCRERHPAFELLEGEFRSLPVDTGAMDLVVSSFAFHHLTDAERDPALRECMRVLRPGGQFLLVDIMFQDEGRLDAARQSLKESWDEENYPLFQELRRVAESIGLEVELQALSDLHGAALFTGPDDSRTADAV